MRLCGQNQSCKGPFTLGNTERAMVIKTQQTHIVLEHTQIRLTSASLAEVYYISPFYIIYIYMIRFDMGNAPV